MNSERARPNKGAAVRRLTTPALRYRSGWSPSSVAERQRYAKKSRIKVIEWILK
jgi:hypothetical protein